MFITVSVQTIFTFDVFLAVFILVLTVLIFNKWRQKRKKATLYLSLMFLFYSIGVWIALAGKWFQYFIDNSNRNYIYFSYLLEYCFHIVANVFLLIFVEHVFWEFSKKRVNVYSSISGIVIGLILSVLSINLVIDSKVLFAVVLYILVSIYAASLIASASLLEMIKTEQKDIKIGLFFIGLFGLLFDFVLLLFFTYWIELYYRNKIHNIIYLIAILIGILALFFAYLGYLLPSWFRKLLRLQTLE